MTIRIAKEKDLSGIMEILNYEIENSTSVYEDHPKDLKTLQQWFSEKKRLRFPVLVAVNENQILGYSSFGKFRPHEGFRLTIEHSIYVAQQFRGKGIGHLLMERLLVHAKELGYHVIVAAVDSTNVKSIRFHEEFEFIEIGRMKEVGQKFGQWLDMVFMQRML